MRNKNIVKEKSIGIWDFERLGFKIPNIMKHPNGCTILLPDKGKEYTDDYCVQTPDFTYYMISAEHAYEIVSQYCKKI